MKKITILFLVFIYSCSTASLVENWKNPDYVAFDAEKVLIVGMTQNQDARAAFESRLKEEFERRNVEAMRSLDVFDIDFTDSKKTEEELDDVEQSLLNKEFDAILLTKIIGSENRQDFTHAFSNWDRYQARFNEDYVTHQEIYYDEGYYDTFTIYQAQTTLYCICEGQERAVIWRGSIDITDPKDIEKSIKDYIKLVVAALEEQDLIFRKEGKYEITGL